MRADILGQFAINATGLRHMAMVARYIDRINYFRNIYDNFFQYECH